MVRSVLSSARSEARAWLTARIEAAESLAFDDRARCKALLPRAIDGNESKPFAMNGDDPVQADARRLEAILGVESPWEPLPPLPDTREVSGAIDIDELRERLARSQAPPASPGTPDSGGTGSGEPVLKPDGWTRSELIDQANHDDGHAIETLSATTFDRIRIAAGVPSAERGGVGAQRRFSVGDLRKLVRVAETGGALKGRDWKSRNGSKIAAAWLKLLPS